MERTLRIILVVIFGFIAQLIDGGIGMGFGVSSASLLLTAGYGVAVTSATVHLAEIFTTFASGISHFQFGNFDKKIFTHLVVSGVIGGVIGTLFAVRFTHIASITIIVSGILLVLGIVIIVKHFRKPKVDVEYTIPRIRRLIPLGFVAAFVDALGGGGWGPITTPALIVSGTNPKKVIGSVNLAEFFVTLAISITFIFTLIKIDYALFIPLTVGALISAPIAAYLTKKVDHRTLSLFAGLLIVVISIRTILIGSGVGFFF